MQGDSHERSVQKGKLEIMALVDHLRIQHREETVDHAHHLYRLAMLHNFTRGRRVNQVQYFGLEFLEALFHGRIWLACTALSTTASCFSLISLAALAVYGRSSKH